MHREYFQIYAKENHKSVNKTAKDMSGQFTEK